MRDPWNTKELLKLYELKKEGKDWNEIGKILKKSVDALQKKYNRMNWDEFLRDPSEHGKIRNWQKWTDGEMIRLDSYLKVGKSYDFIAKELGRSLISVERQAQDTDWKAWRAIHKVGPIGDSNISVASETERAILINQYVKAILDICRYDFDKLKSLRQNEFLNRVNLDRSNLFIGFEDLKIKAQEELIILGYGNPETVDFGPGTYVVVGDSHGKHTKKKMFDLLRQVSKHFKPTKVIHIGHILDDDNDISYDWGDIDNLVILSKGEELKIIQEQRNKYKFNFEVVRACITLGKDLCIFNQDMIADYVKTSISHLDAETFGEKIIVNCHRHEFYTRCSNDDASYYASPGCLCENHIIRTIKQINFEDGRVVKQAFWDGFSKYRRMRHTNKYWELGMLIVHVAQDGTHTIIPCAIKKVGSDFATSYFDKIITSEGVVNPDKKIFVNGDIHSDKHDCNALDIQEQVCNDYKPDAFVSMGDTHNYYALNHHVMDRGGVILNKKILAEAAQTHYILKKMEKWSRDNYIIYGNHERFAKDFIEKFPQFSEYLEFGFLCGVKDLNYKNIALKDLLEIGSAKFIHGEIRMYGQNGNKLEKAARTFGRDIFIGHIHSPSIRFGCYSIGLTGELDQEYNETNASNWLHGFGLCNQYKGKSWMTTISICNNSCIMNKKNYKPKNPESWNMTDYKASISFDVK
jgi:hypothetical protein